MGRAAWPGPVVIDHPSNTVILPLRHPAPMFGRKREEDDVVQRPPRRGYDWGRGHTPVVRA